MSIYLRGDTFHYDFVVDGKRHRGTTGIKNRDKKSRKTAEEREITLRSALQNKYSLKIIWEQAKNQMTVGAQLPVDLEAVWKVFSARAMKNAQDKRKKTYYAHVKNFIEWLKTNHQEIDDLAAVSDSVAVEYFNSIVAQPGANSSKNEKISTLKRLFSSFGKAYGILDNPFDGIEYLRVSKVEREIFTQDELRRIGDNATGWIKSLCLTALCTGLREGDICMLKKNSVKLNTHWISIPAVRKTNRPIDIPLMPALEKHIIECFREFPESEFVYPELADMYQHHHEIIGKKIKEFFDSIGITDTQAEVKGYARKMSRKDVHSFRHTFVYLAALNGIPFPLVQSIVGHSSPAMTKIYMDHADRQDKENYFKRLPQYAAKKSLPGKKPIKERLEKLLNSVTSDNLDRVRPRLLRLLRS